MAPVSKNEVVGIDDDQRFALMKVGENDLFVFFLLQPQLMRCTTYVRVYYKRNFTPL